MLYTGRRRLHEPDTDGLHRELVPLARPPACCASTYQPGLDGQCTVRSTGTYHQALEGRPTNAVVMAERGVDFCRASFHGLTSRATSPKPTSSSS